MNIINQAVALVMAVITVTGSATSTRIGSTMTPQGRADNESQIYEFMTDELDMNMAAACGVLANIEQESDFDPTASCIDTNGLTSYGICQWNGPRFTSLRNWCANHGYYYWTLTGQLKYLKYELQTSERTAYNSVKNVANTASGAYTAGYNWAAKFERCASRYYYGRAVSARDKYWPKYLSLLNFDCSSTNPDDYMYPSRTLKEGNTGKDVAWVQAVLYQLGYSIDIDGEFGAITTGRVKSFQKSNNLEYDGIVGYETRAKLNSKWEDKKNSNNKLTISGTLDGKSGKTFGTFDVYINGGRSANDVTSYDIKLGAGSSYEIKDIRPASGVSYSGVSQGSAAGSVGLNTKVTLGFTTIPADMGVDTKRETWNGHTYILVPRKSTWYEAAYYSEKLGGSLVSVNSSDEEKFLRQFTGGNVWIGATDKDSEGTWKWVSGDRFSYTNWSSGQPNNSPKNDERSESYVYLCSGSTNSAGWDDEAGYAKMYFVCETNSVPVTIVTQPTDVQVAKAGDTATVSVEAKGDGLKYQWYYKDPNQTKFSVCGTNSKSYSIAVTTARDGRQQYCVITDKYGNKVTTNTVTLTIAEQRTELKIVTQPTDVQVARAGDTATVSVEAKGDGLKYQWYYKDPNQTKFSVCGTNSKSYSIAVTTARDGRQQYCVITDKYGNKVTTNTVTLTIAEQRTELKIVTQPTDVEVLNEGATAKTSVVAQGDGLKYQWYIKDTASSSFSKSSITTNTYSVSMTQSRNGRQLYCIITDKYDNKVTTNTVKLTIAEQRTELKILTQPTDVEVANVDDKATVTVEAQGDGLKYQWYYMNPNQSKFFTCGSNSNTYSVAVTAERDGRRQYCVITDKYGNTVQSDTVTLTVAEQKKELRIITQPTDVEVTKAGDVATVTVEAEGDGLKYQWYYKNPNQLRFYACGASSSSYSTAVTAIRNGRQQYCVITDTYGNIVTTDTVTLTIAMSNNGSEIITLPVEDVIEQNDEESVESEITEPIED